MSLIRSAELFHAPSLRAASLELSDLSKDFPIGSAFSRFRGASSTRILKRVNLNVQPGEAVALVGPNGAGKTTLLEILSTLLLPTEGEVRICGMDVVRESREVRRVVSYCASTPMFYPRLSGAGNLQFFARLLGVRSPELRIKQLLDLVRIEGARDQHYQKYSDGMRQRLSFARALLIQPRVLLLDEPTRSLDPIGTRDVIRLLRRTIVEEMGVTLILATHSLEEAEAVCDRIAILRDGRIVAIGNATELTARFGVSGLSAVYEHVLQRAG